jgi:rubrerythrin
LIFRKLTKTGSICQPPLRLAAKGGAMSLLRTEPPAAVKSLDELFAIAHAMEHEAATRYAEIAVRMRHEGNHNLAQVFERLSADERGHMDGVMRWSENQRGKAPDPALIQWQLPETFDDEGLSTVDPHLLSAYRALATAVRNEERAFAFWTYVAAQATAPEIQRAAETMAHEELGHVATLRRERRAAFHRERAAGNEAAGAGNRVAAAVLEQRLAGLLESLAAGAPSAERLRLKELSEEAKHHAEELEGFAITLPAHGTHEIPDDPLVLAELLADRYIEAADNLPDEEALGRIQAFAGRAISRLAWLRSDLPELVRP